MKILLIEEVKGLGDQGQVKEVAEGYARNYLIPKKLAVMATPGALKELEIRQAAEKKRQAKVDEEMRTLGKNLGQTSVTIKAKVGEGGKLYGSITSSDVAEALQRQTGQEVDKRKIEIEEPIRHVGTYKVPVKLSKNVTTNVNVVVEGEEGE